MAILKRGSIRGIQTLLGQQVGVSPYSSNSSIEGRDPRDGRVSPSPSFATSLEVSLTVLNHVASELY
jgi:PH and SEC7 domain-containing protein